MTYSYLEHADTVLTLVKDNSCLVCSFESIRSVYHRHPATLFNNDFKGSFSILSSLR